MDLNFEGILLAVCTFLIIGLCHPLVIKTEYYFGTKPWWLWLIAGIACCVAALLYKVSFGLLYLVSLELHSFGELVSSSRRRSVS